MNLKFLGTKLYLFFCSILVLVYTVTGFNLNMSNDLYIYSSLLEYPFAIINGVSEYPQYPVLQGLLFIPVALLRLLGISDSTGFQIYFSLLGLVATHAIDRIITKYSPIMKVLTAVIVATWIFLLCSILVQEDVIGLIFMILALRALRRNRPYRMLFILSSAIVFAKLFFIFLVPPLLLLIFLHQRRLLLPLVATFPGVVVLFLSISNYLNQNQEGLWNFSTPLSLSINAWSLSPEEGQIFGLSWKVISYICLILALLFYYLLFSFVKYGMVEIVLIYSIIGCVLLAFLYQIQPEYLFLLIPVIYLPHIPKYLLASMLALFPLALVQNIFYSFGNSDQIYNSKAKINTLNAILEVLPFLSSDYYGEIAACLFSIFSLIGLIQLTKQIKEPMTSSLRRINEDSN
jgi:hypothetical protein